MSQRGGRPIDFQAWAQNQIVKRTVAALEARDEAFAERNADTPLPQLARYLSRCAISLGHSPSPSEVDGGTFIEQRFGGWARLPQPRSMRKLRDTARYKAEKVKQEPLFREERRQKRQRKMEQSEQRKQEQAIKKRAERAAKAEWAAKKKAEAEAKALTLAETSAEAALDTISAAINPSQAETV